MTRKSVLVLSSTYPRWVDDNEPAFVHELSKRLTDRMDVTVVCPSADGARRLERLDNVKVVRYRYAPNAMETLVQNGGIVGNIRSRHWKLALLPTFFLSQLFTTLWLCFRRRPSVIHAHWLIPQGIVAAIVFVLSRKKIPFVITSHGTDLWSFNGRFWRALKRFVVRRASVVAVVSEAMKKELNKQIGDVNNVEVAPMGVDLKNTFKPDLDATRIPRQIISVGRLIETKGVEHLIKALPDLVQRFPDVSLVIVGDGPDRERLEAIADELCVAAYCVFKGKLSQKELPDLYCSSSVFVAPFLQEGLGLVCVEALGCGCAVVVSDIPAIRDILEHSENIHIVPTQSSEAIAQAITKVFESQDAGPLSVERSQATLREKFSWESVTENYSQILSQVW